jgi:toxin CptA
MLVHYFRIERSRVRVDRLFDPVGTSRLPDVNWAGFTAFFAGILATWLFMYGLIPAFQGPVAVAMGGVDLSWLAGGLTSALVYSLLGPVAAAKHDQVPAPQGAETPQVTA